MKSRCVIGGCAVFLMLLEGGVLLAKNPETGKKPPGTVYLTWGYNREAYSKTKLHLYNTKTDNYDFTIEDAKAHDYNNFEAIGPIDQLTIPQYNLHLGYLFNDEKNLGIELSWDHLKYIVTDYQTLRVTGNIRGQQINQDTLVSPNFVHIQHTNGNNYLMFNVLKKSSLFKRPSHEISIHNKAGAGVLYSFTISTVLNSYDHGHFKPQGYVVALNSGLRYDFYRYFFLEATVQGAFAHYLNSDIGADRQGKLRHHFFSAAAALQFGFNMPLEIFNRNK